MKDVIAKAICQIEEPDGLGNWEDYLKHADAVLKAIMEPNAEMIAAGESAHHEQGIWNDGCDSAEIYRSMMRRASA